MLLWAVVGLCFGMKGRVRGVDCVCVTEAPCSSANYGVGCEGAASLAQALEKNTTLQTLCLNGEFVVVCCDFGGGFIVVYVVVGCCWVVFFGGGACAWC